MISCLSSTCHRRQALRAVLIALVALTGCQGSMRTWRRDDSSLHDLVVTPHPRDEQRASDDVSQRNNYADRNRSAQAKTGRANPYASPSSAERLRFAPTDDVAEVGGDEDLNFDVEDAEFKSVISQADPKHRAMLVQMYQAVQARRQALESETDTQRDDDYASDERANLKSVAKKNRRSDDEVQPAHYSLSDSLPDSLPDSLSDDVDTPVRQASATRSLNMADQLGNRKLVDKTTKERDEPVHYSMSDEAGEGVAERQATTTNPRNKQPTRPQEVKPPTKSRADKRTVKEPMADTGYEEQIPGLPAARGPREDATIISSRKHTPAYEQADDVDSHYTDRSYVAPASAETSTASNAEPDVQPATLRPSSRSSSRNSTSLQQHASPQSNSSTHSNSQFEEDGERDAAVDQDWRELAHQTLRSLENESVDSSANAQLNHHVTKRILFVLLDQLEQALEPIPGLQPHEQEYFRHNFQALYNSIDTRGNPVLSRRWPLVMEDHRTAMSHLAAVSNLEVKNAAFCSNVDGFGAVTKFPTNQFRPNQELLLYCEVENFVSEQKKDGYETKLRGNYEIVDANQTRVADFLLPEEVDMCKRPRRDYFFVYRIYTPQHIAPGRYQLRLTIEDMKGNKFGQTSLDMQISGQ